MSEATEGIRVNERVVRFPRSISEAAQSAMRRIVNADGIPLNALVEAPAFGGTDDVSSVQSIDARFYARQLEVFERNLQSSVETAQVGMALVHVATPKVERHPRCALVEFHEGGLIQGDCFPSRISAQHQADLHGVTCYGVDYRHPPLHSFPIPLEDCLAAYRHVMTRYSPDRVVLCGRSAGGNLAVATLLRAKDEGWPSPAALVLLSPQLDLTESGDSFQVNRHIDVVLPTVLTAGNVSYAGGVDLRRPYLSPLFGSFDGFPPTFLQSGTRDLFLSNAVRMHRQLRKRGVSAELHVFEAMPHGGFGGSTPEDKELTDEVARFIDKQWRSHRRPNAWKGSTRRNVSSLRRKRPEQHQS
jgi:acetyl esterase/lipase